MIKRLPFFVFLFNTVSGYAQPQTLKKYNSVFLNSGLTYLPKPGSFDSLNVSNYISAGYIRVSEASTINNNDDAVNMFNVALSRAHVFDQLNIAYGIDGFFGTYKNEFLPPKDPNYFSRRAVSGLQLKTSLNLLKSSKSFDFRFIGLDLSYSKEFGEFARFRRAIIDRDNFYAIPRTGLFTAGLSSEILFKGKSPDTQFGFRFAVQNAFGNLRYKGTYLAGYDIFKENSVSISGASYLQLNKYFLIFELGNAARLNIGYKF